MFAGHGDERKAELTRRSLNAKADVSHAAGDVGGDGRVGKLLTVKAFDRCAVQTIAAQQVFEQQACTGARLAVDETS